MNAPDRTTRIAALKQLLGVMMVQAQPRDQLVAAAPAGDFDPTKLARESAASAVRIAHDCANLGLEGQDNQALATDLWNESLAQIGRIQKLYHLDPLPFQQQPPLPGPSSDT